MIFDIKIKDTKEKEKETIEIRNEEETLLDIETIEESNAKKIVICIMASLPHSPTSLHVSPSPMDKKPKENELELV